MKSRIVIFAAGVLFGLAIAMYFGLGKRPEPATEPVVCPPSPAPIAAPAPQCPTSAEDIRADEKRAERLKLEELRAKELQAPEPAPAAPKQPPLQPPPDVPEPAPPEPPPPTPPEPPAALLLIPVEGIKASQLRDTFTESRGGGRVHDAIDILAPKGTPVRAVDDGRVVKLFKSVPGGLTVYQFDPAGKFAYYYAHLDGYAPGLAEGQELKRGDLIGYVGSTGNAIASAPHLHFAIFVLGPKKLWWEGIAINPYPLLTGGEGSAGD